MSAAWQIASAHRHRVVLCFDRLSIAVPAGGFGMVDPKRWLPNGGESAGRWARVRH